MNIQIISYRNSCHHFPQKYWFFDFICNCRIFVTAELSHFTKINSPDWFQSDMFPHDWRLNNGYFLKLTVDICFIVSASNVGNSPWRNFCAKFFYAYYFGAIICVGRLFDAHVLDMFELGIEKFRSMQEFRVSQHWHLFLVTAFFII